MAPGSEWLTQALIPRQVFNATISFSGKDKVQNLYSKPEQLVTERCFNGRQISSHQVARVWLSLFMSLGKMCIVNPRDRASGESSNLPSLITWEWK